MADTSINLKSILDVIDSTLKTFDFGVNLDKILMGLCFIAITYHFGKIAVDNLINPSNAFSFQSFKTPIFYVIVLVAWPQLYGFILDASNGMAQTIVSKNQKVLNANENNYAKMDKMMADIELSYAEALALKNKQDSDSGFAPDWIQKMVISFQTIDDRILIGLFKMIYGLAIYFDAFIYLIFYFITKFYLKFVLMGGGIALTISLFTGFTTLVNWAKTVLSVSLWIPVSAIAFQLINTILLSVIENQLKTSLIINEVGDMGSSNFTGAFLQALGNALVLTVIFIGLKLIVLSKVPAIINTWINGGGDLAGGFSGGFIPVAMAGMAAKAAAGTTAGAAANTIKSLKRPDNE